ncbi:MAG: hypothetical protein J0M01_14695, partial [Dechloromonas sp.]|nr:hypothetical protein [Dechloromonas sp.]
MIFFSFFSLSLSLSRMHLIRRMQVKERGVGPGGRWPRFEGFAEDAGLSREARAPLLHALKEEERNEQKIVLSVAHTQTRVVIDLQSFRIDVMDGDSVVLSANKHGRMVYETTQVVNKDKLAEISRTDSQGLFFFSLSLFLFLFFSDFRFLV